MSTSAFSGVILDQNAPQADPINDWLAFGTNVKGIFPDPTLMPSPTLYPSSGASYAQTFALPIDFARGSVIPDLTGFQIYLNVPTDQAAQVGLTWELDVQIAGAWTNLAADTMNGTILDGAAWSNIYFTAPVTIDPLWLTNMFRLQLSDAGSYQAGYSTPNPLSTGALYYILPGSSAMVPVVDNANGLSVMFRILASVADSGTDYFNNRYRSAVVTTSASNVSTANAPLAPTSWLSQPSPSKFAVESLYFDVRDNGSPAVIDRVTIDPLTPNISFHLYYSNDATGPGHDPPSWENLLWTPVYKTFQASRKATYALPTPIGASYVKIEFSTLQARSYDPGEFELPTTFKKHPKWVLDYFLARFAAQPFNFVSSTANVTYDALDLAFTYYSGDLTQNPDPPAQGQPLTGGQSQFFAQENASLADPTTLGLINYAFQPFTAQPALLGRFGSIIGQYAARTAPTSYTVENVQRATADTSIVSNLNREPLLVEKGFPVMFFFIPCRHSYRISQASYDRHTAYFAGVRSVTFHREHYTQAADLSQYNETLGDGANVAINDFA